MAELSEVVRTSRAWACYDCGKCTATCPVARVGGTLSPRRHVLAASARNADTHQDETLFRCLTCSLCETRCPAQVNYTALLRSMRELAAADGAEPDCPHGGALHSVMRMMARGGTQQDRLSWIDDGLDVEHDRGEVLLWTGCAVYYDAFFPELEAHAVDANRAAVKVLNALGIRPVIARDERCCGHDLLWNGDRPSFEALAKHNAALVQSSGAGLVVASCAECLRTLKLDIQPFFKGTPPRMLHMSELIGERLADLKLKGSTTRKITFQDPCRLGRHLGVTEAPRHVLGAIPGVELSEMRHNRASAACCAGGTWSNCDRYAKRLQVERLQEARATGADVLATACPKCRIHFSCTMQDTRLGDNIKIEMRDVTELVADALE